MVFGFEGLLKTLCYYLGKDWLIHGSRALNLLSSLFPVTSPFTKCQISLPV